MKNKKTFIATMFSAMFSLLCPAQDAIPLRGVVEGYYGRPWGTEGRLSLLKFMGEQKMNVFIYGPKDDPYHHHKWREAYPEAEMNDFKKLLSVAQKEKIHFYWAIHLGGSFDVAKEKDFTDLNNKLSWMYDAGFRAFAVFFDDYGNADASAHAKICNRIVNEFFEKHNDCAPLIMCPNAYSGTGNEYQKILGNELDMRVNVMWTGRAICCDIRADDVGKITAALKRPPFIWWNWPVNDYCASRILLGRTYGIEPAKVAGFVTNPMENCEASKIAIYSIAKWCLNPEAFRSQETWEESFSKLYPNAKIAKAMRVFAEHNSDQCSNVHGYRREESVVAREACDKARKEFEENGVLTDETCDELSKFWNELLNASRILKNELTKSRYDLGWELEGWLDAEIALMEEGLETLKIVNEKAKGKSFDKILSSVRAIRKRAEEDAKRHKEKFGNATFANARSRVVAPKPSGSVFSPLIEKLLEEKLRKLYFERTGDALEKSGGPFIATSAKNVPALIPVREEKNAT